jgi:SnoaL-like domain
MRRLAGYLQKGIRMPQSTDLEARLRALEEKHQTLLDQNDIHRLVIRSCLLVDLKQLHRMASEVFSEDARLDFGMAVFNGRREIHEFYTGYEGNLLGSCHALTNVFIEVSGDTAKSTSYCQAWHWHAQSAPKIDLVPTDILVIGGYQDQMVRTTEGWRIRERITNQYGTGVGVGAPTPPIKPVLEGNLGRLPTWPRP